MADFDWMQSRTQRNDPETTRAMRREELTTRAGLLARLNYSPAQAEARLQANLAWEYETSGKAAVAGEVSAIVKEAFAMAGRAKRGRRKKS